MRLLFYGRMSNMKDKYSGFTLIEIMVVTFIVSVLVSMAIVEAIALRKSANESNCQANLKTIGTAFELYAVKNGGAYAQQEETDLQFLIDAGCLHVDLTGKQLGNFSYKAESIGPEGYDIRAMAVNQALADHNYQIITGARLRRSDTSDPGDTNFKDF